MIVSLGDNVSIEDKYALFRNHNNCDAMRSALRASRRRNQLETLRLHTDEQETNDKINEGTFLFSNKFYFCLTNKVQGNNFKS